MVSLFDMSHLKGRYQAMIKDRSVKLHATISELIGTGIVVFIGTYSSGIVTEAQASLSTGHPASTLILQVLAVTYGACFLSFRYVFLFVFFFFFS